MTLKQLRILIASQPIADDEREVKIWLPGSTISLSFGDGRMIRRDDTMLIEGNLDEGSALDAARYGMEA